ncbi:ATP-binding protein, partial [Treponema sp.]
MGGKTEKKAAPASKETGAGKAAPAATKSSVKQSTKTATAAKTAAKAPAKTTAAMKIVPKAAAKTSAKATKASPAKAEPEKFSAWSNAKTVKKSKKEVEAEKKTAARMAKSAEESEKKLAAAKQIDPASQREKKEVQDYGDDKIKHLDALEHIRLRSGMYIGRLGNGSNENDGIYVLMKEVIDNSIDEFIVGFGKQIEVSVADGRVKVRDYGRGIPLGKVVECVSQINTGAKYNDDVFQFSVGMNGVGTKAVNALSSYFRVVSVRDGKCTDAVFEKGKLVSQKTGSLKNPQKNGTYFEFVPDEEIFGKYSFNMEFVESRMWNYAFLNPGLTIKLNGQEYKSDNGLLDLLSKELGSSKDKENLEPPLYDVGSYSGEHLKFAFSHVSGVNEIYFSFVNGQYTSDGGTHLNAFKEGFIKGIREFYGENFDIDDIRFGLRAAVLVKIKDPIFESQTKNKLGNTDIKQWIVAETQSGLDAWLHKNPKAAEKIKDKIKANEKYRTDLSKVKKEAKELDRKTSVRIEKLKDCHYHLQDGEKGENSMIFITEGQSASGTMTHSRNAD